MAEQGLTFVGFLQQPGGGACFLGHWDPEELSSLHSSPSPIHRNPLSPTEPRQDRRDRRRSEPWDLNGDDAEQDEGGEEEEDGVKADLSPLRCVSGSELHQGATEAPVGRRPPRAGRRSSRPTWLGTPYAASPTGGGPRPRLPDIRPSNQRNPRSSAPDNWFSSPDLQNSVKTLHNNNNHDDDDDEDEDETRHKSCGLASPAGRRRKKLLPHQSTRKKTFTFNLCLFI